MLLKSIYLYPFHMDYLKYYKANLFSKEETIIDIGWTKRTKKFFWTEKRTKIAALNTDDKEPSQSPPKYFYFLFFYY